MAGKETAELRNELASLGENVRAVLRQYSGTPNSGPNSSPVEVRCKVIFDGTAALREEFGNLERYTAYIRATESGLAKIHQPDIGKAYTDHAQRGDSYDHVSRCKAAFESTVALRAEFGNLERYTAYIRATESGLAKVHQPAIGL